MKSFRISFQEANQNLVWILLVGLTSGIANYALGAWDNVGKSIVQQTIISLLIGYGIVLISFNATRWFSKDFSPFKKYSIIIALFCLVGILGSELQWLSENVIFQKNSYQFLGGGGIYLFNVIMTCLLGFLVYNWAKLKAAPTPEVEQTAMPSEQAEEPLQAIPIKRGEAIALHPVEAISYFEAYDNYSFLHDLQGNKSLCNYSLLFLEKRLDKRFLRVHRKYLINKEQIRQIKPHLKGRFVIEFKDNKQPSITSGSTYADIIKAIIKL